MSNLTQQLTPQQIELLTAMGRCARPELIRRLLRHRGLTQMELSRRHGLPFTSINQTILGNRPNPRVRAMLAGELGLPEWVLFESDCPDAPAGRQVEAACACMAEA